MWEFQDDELQSPEAPIEATESCPGGYQGLPNGETVSDDGAASNRATSAKPAGLLDVEAPVVSAG